LFSAHSGIDEQRESAADRRAPNSIYGGAGMMVVAGKSIITATKLQQI
jgi:hypothetical protein